MKLLRNILALLLVSTLLSACTFLNKPQQAGLQVITNDIPSSVYLDGQLVDKTPFIEKTLKPGSYTLKIQPDNSDLVAHETSINLNPNSLTVVTWKPEKKPELSGGVIYEMEPLKDKNSSEISFVSVPDGAIIQLEGMPKDFAPTIIPNVEPGHHEYEITLPSYETQKHTINVIKGFRMIVKVKLAKLEEISDSEPSVVDESKEASASATSNGTDLSQAKQASLSGVTELGQDLEISEKATSSAESGQTVTIKSTGYFRNSIEVLRVRDQAGPQGKEIGFAPVNSSYSYLGESKNNWYKISFNGAVGWVSGDFSQLSQ